MRFNEIIKTVMKETKTTQTQLGKMLGVSQGAVSNVVRRDETSLATFQSMMEAMGYEVVVQPRAKGRRKEGQLVLTEE